MLLHVAPSTAVGHNYLADNFKEGQLKNAALFSLPSSVGRVPLLHPRSASQEVKVKVQGDDGGERESRWGGGAGSSVRPY